MEKIVTLFSYSLITLRGRYVVNKAYEFSRMINVFKGSHIPQDLNCMEESVKTSLNRVEE